MSGAETGPVKTMHMVFVVRQAIINDPFLLNNVLLVFASKQDMIRRCQQKHLSGKMFNKYGEHPPSLSCFVLEFEIEGSRELAFFVGYLGKNYTCYFDFGYYFFTHPLSEGRCLR